MNVRRAVLAGFFTHTDTDVAFPPKGLIAVTGPNGGGKSSLIEAVSYALWGKTLRGADPWAGDRGNVSLSSDVVDVVRLRAGGRVRLGFSTDAPSPVYETNTKSQDALTAIVGSHDVWRRSCVFSASDAAHFTLATDGERKRLLESILGLERFDVALDGCRADLKVAELAEREETDRARNSLALLEGERKRQEDARAALGKLESPTDRSQLDDDNERLRGEIDIKQTELRALSKKIRLASSAGAEQTAVARAALDLHNRLRSHDACPTCAQTIPSALLAKLSSGADAAAKLAQSVRDDALAAVQGLDSRCDELTEEIELLTATQRNVEQALAVAITESRMRAQQQKVLVDSTARVDALTKEAFERSLKSREHQTECGTLAAVSQVLGLKGVRAHVLGRALSGLEIVANGWLSRIAGEGLILKLRPYAEKKTGGVTDSLSLSIEGAGNGHGYSACSAGERRRIDLSLLFALGEVAAAAHGQAPGSLFVDECLDSLDDEGVDRACTALRELANERCVVVISHNARVKLEPDIRWHVEGGKVRVL